MNLQQENFIFKDHERNRQTSISVKSNDYLVSVKLIRGYFRQFGYHTAEAVGAVNRKNRMVAIANVVVRNSDFEMACLITVRYKREKTSSGVIIKRVTRFLKYWDTVGVFFGFRTGNGVFPITFQRIFGSIKTDKLKIFSLNLTTGKIKEIRRNDFASQTDEKEAGMDT